MLVNIKVTGGLNIESGQIDPKATGGLTRNDMRGFLTRGHARNGAPIKRRPLCRVIRRT